MLKTTVTVLILQPQRIEKRHKLFIKKPYFYINTKQSSEHFDRILFSGSCSLPNGMFRSQKDPLSSRIYPSENPLARLFRA